MSRLQLNPKVAVAVVYVMAMFMAIMDITIVNVALPTLARDFHLATTDTDVVVTGFLVSLAVFIPASGWLGDRFGTKRVLLVAIAIFTVASALCGQAHSITELTAFRILQGAGGGMLTPVGLAMLFRVYPPEERVRASRILIIPTALAPALGPVVGGFLVTNLSWRWVFYVNVPIGALAFLFGLLFLHEQREDRPGRFDLGGFVLAGVGFALLMYAISVGPSSGWSSPEVLASAASGVIMLIALVVVELRIREPLLDLRLLRDRLFATTSLIMFLAMAAFLGTLYLVPLFYQDGLGLSALMSGLSTFPEALGVMIGAQISGRLYPRFGPRRVVVAGALLIAVMMATFTLGGSGTNLWYLRLILFFMGMGAGHVFVPLQAAGFATIAPSSMGRASGFFNADRQLGSAVGVALLTTVAVAVGLERTVNGVTRPDLGAYHTAFWLAAGLAALSSLVALRIRDTDAAVTMRRKTLRVAATEADETDHEGPVLISD